MHGYESRDIIARGQTQVINGPALVLLHIIDDLNAIAYDLPDDFVLAFQSNHWKCLIQNELLPREEKCAPKGLLERELLPFIGYFFDLRAHIVRPKAGRIALARSLMKQNDQWYRSLSSTEWQMLVEKMFWLALTRPPLIFVFNHESMQSTALKTKRSCKQSGNVEILLVKPS